MSENAKRLFTLVLGPVLMLFSASLLAETAPMNMPKGVTAVGHEIYDLHMLVLYISLGIGLVVFGFMFWSMIFHRKSVGHQAESWHESLSLEIAWTVVPFIILFFMAYPATKVLLDVYDTKDPDMDIMVTGYQWKWKYEYLGEDVSFFSNLSTPRSEINNETPKGSNYLLEVDEPLYIPVGKKVRFLVTANDVIHAWWVPELAVKKDAIPGFVNETWTRADKTGVFRGQCAELCGKDHGFMPIVVNVVEQAEYDEWLNKKKAEAAELAELMKQSFTLEEMIARGEKVYEGRCAACHGADGAGTAIAPSLIGSPYVVGPIMDHLDMVVNGSKTNPAMQAFGGQLNDLDMAAVVTYERNAWGNNMGDKLDAVQVYEYKKQ